VVILVSRTYVTGQYNGFLLRHGKGNEVYRYDTTQLRNIIGLLTQARETMSRPCVYEFTLIIEEPQVLDEIIQPSSFNSQSIKTVLPASHYLYHWTIEYSKEKCLHVHIMVIFDQKYFYPSVHWQSLQKQFSMLDGVKSASLKPRFNGLGKYHAIKDEAEYIDACESF
jgi:hypothetical protein